jgi:hypothetical protein
MKHGTYQVGRAERPEATDATFAAFDAALAHAKRESIGDYVIAVWQWAGDDAQTLCLVYQGDVYESSVGQGDVYERI